MGGRNGVCTALHDVQTRMARATGHAAHYVAPDRLVECDPVADGAGRRRRTLTILDEGGVLVQRWAGCTDQGAGSGGDHSVRTCRRAVPRRNVARGLETRL